MVVVNGVGQTSLLEMNSDENGLSNDIRQFLPLGL